MATAWCHWRILPSDLLCGKSVFTDVPGEQWEPEMVRRAGGCIGNVSVSQDAKSLLVKYVSGFLNMLLNPIHKALRISVRWVKKKLTRLRKNA